MRKRLTSGIVLLVAAPVALLASSVAPVNLQELSTLAQRIVAGRVERIESYQDTATGMIRSRLRIAESRRVDGAAPASLTLDMVGGTFGGVRQWIAGFPDLAAGDHVVLFLAADTATPLGPTVGLWQGVFFVETDAATGADTILNHRRQPVTGIRDSQLLLEEPGPPGAVRQAAPRLRLDEFLRRVATLRSAPAGGDRR